ncbi:MAG: NB-ARC domain-containing protein [Leptolyngbyaceae bacterium]|nr:NB-ARC domain-containing protein [Leptolyngbyaceae bacterium]
MPDTLNASTQGLAIADQARLRKGWTKTSTACWWQDAHTSRATLRRFWRGEKIQRDAFIAICEAVGISDWRRVAEGVGPEVGSEVKSAGELESDSPLMDWGEAPDLRFFCGRSQLLQSLETLMVTDPQCRFMSITGMAGIGKTALALALADRVQGEVDGIIWRSLHAYPSLTAVLESILATFHDQADTPHRQIHRLLNRLKNHRYLVVLDGLDALMAHADPAQPTEPNLQTCLMELMEVPHKSCIVVTSREALPIMESPFAAPMSAVPLPGLSAHESDQLLLAMGLTGTAAERRALGHLYGGNPLAMQLAVPVIQSMFVGKMSAFLQNHTPFVGDRLRALLNQHLEKLTPLERDIVYWLAIWQEPIPLNRLHTHLFPTPEPIAVLECLVRLEGRSLLCKTFFDDDPAFTLPPLVMETVVAELVERATSELLQFLQPVPPPSPHILRTHCLLRPGTDDIAGDRILMNIHTSLMHRAGAQVTHIFHALEDWLNAPSHPPTAAIIGYATQNAIALQRVLFFLDAAY